MTTRQIPASLCTCSMTVKPLPKDVRSFSSSPSTARTSVSAKRSACSQMQHCLVHGGLLIMLAFDSCWPQLKLSFGLCMLCLELATTNRSDAGCGDSARQIAQRTCRHS